MEYVLKRKDQSRLYSLPILGILRRSTFSNEPCVAQASLDQRRQDSTPGSFTNTKHSLFLKSDDTVDWKGGWDDLVHCYMKSDDTVDWKGGWDDLVHCYLESDDTVDWKGGWDDLVHCYLESDDTVDWKGGWDHLVHCYLESDDTVDWKGGWDDLVHCYNPLCISVFRCGVDTSVEDSQGRTAEDLLVSQDSRTGRQDMLHWYSKFKPGELSCGRGEDC